MRLATLCLSSSLAALAGCGAKNPITAPGTVLFDWDASKSSRASFRAATIGAHTSKDFTVTLDDKAPFVVSVHVEVAPVELEEDGAKVKQLAPVAFKATVKSNDTWELSGRCHDGPNYQMPRAGKTEHVTPDGMVQDCWVSFQRSSGVIFKSSYQLGRSLIANGDGTLKGFPEQGVKIE